MIRYTVNLILVFVFLACQHQPKEKTAYAITNYQEHWSLLQYELSNNNLMMWDTIISIDGKKTSDLMLILNSEESKNAIAQTDYKDLVEMDFFGKKVKVMKIKSASATHEFYISETQHGLKIIGHF